MIRERHIEIHVPNVGTDERSLARIRLVVQEILCLLEQTKDGTLTGEEVGSGETTLSFECHKPELMVPKLRDRLARSNLLRGSFAVIYSTRVPDNAGVKVPLDDEQTMVNGLAAASKLRSGRQGHHPRLGDYFAIPLPDGRYGHLRYSYRDAIEGDLVEVLAVICQGGPANFEEIVDSKLLFPPVITSVAIGVRVGGWVFLGNTKPAEKFQFPIFRGTNSLLLRRHEPGVYDDWWLWSGGDSWTFAGKLDMEQRKLEYHVAWPPQLLAKRIATMENEYDNFW